jgi:hypothetical protein
VAYDLQTMETEQQEIRPYNVECFVWNPNTSIPERRSPNSNNDYASLRCVVKYKGKYVEAVYDHRDNMRGWIIRKVYDPSLTEPEHIDGWMYILRVDELYIPSGY